jgi:hypothetical protein
MEEVPVKRRRRRRSFPVKLTFDGKTYGGYSYEIQGYWLTLDHGDGLRSWFSLDKVKTFSIKEKLQPVVQEVPVVRAPMRFSDLTPLVNVEPGAIDAPQAELFSKARNRQLEEIMGPDVG